jgi:hypothetical protein
MRNLTLFCFFAVLIGFSSKAQIAFQQNVVTDQTHGIINPNSVISGDIDGDGLKDVIASGINEVAWFKNLDNNSNFSNANTIYLEYDNMRNLQLADIDTDGDLDVFFYLDNNQGSALVWTENTDGLGAFGPPQILVVNDNTSPIGYQIIDVDADGDLDISFGYRGFIGWIENDNMTFSATTLLGSPNTSSSNYQNFVTIDVNGDNLKDFVIDLGQDLRVYDFQPDASLGFIGTIGTFAQGNFTTAADIDNDGDNDIIRIFENGGNDRKIRWYENTDGQGAFANAQTLIPLQNLPQTSNQDSKSLQLIDINGDNLLDVVFNESNTGTLSTFINSGNNTFSSENIIANDFININSIFVDDINGDNQPDVLITSREDCQVSWFSNEGQGNFSSEKFVTTYTYFVNHTDAGDIDGDGDPDIVSSSHADSKLAWYRNTNGFGDFSEDQIIISKTIPAPREAYIVDMNGDGFNDVLCFSYLDGFPDDEYTIRWLENDGTGSFIQDHIIDNVSEILSRIQYADIDNDGDMDVISAENESVLKLYKNNGDGTFSSAITFSSPGFYFPLSLEVGDVDNDGDIDVLASYNNNEIIWHENSDGQGELTTKHVITPQMNYPSAIYLADINGDTFKDVLFANRSLDEIGYFLNTDGLGNFGPKIVLSDTPDNPTTIYALDADEDGDLDIFTNSETGSRLIWFENNGSGTFSTAIEITVNTERINDINSADLNADGRPDLLTSSYDDDQIAWYDNLGTFTNTLSGQVKLDANADGCDDTDAGIANLLISTDNGTNSFATFTQADGSYSFLADQKVFTTSVSSALPNYYISNPASHTDDFTNLFGTAITSDFCVEASQAINDLSVVIYPNLNEPRPGFDTSYKIVYSNSGTTSLSGDITFQFDDSKIQFLNASEMVTSQTANTLTFNYSNLNPFETRTIDLDFNVFPPPTTNIDDELISTVSINPVAGDETQDDNTFELNQTVIGSYDPNDIQILEGDQVHIDDANEYLHFLIRFQNTGTASAINVRVEHILDDKLDWTTMQLQSLSHDGRVEITDGSDVQFIFNNINLPDQTSDEEGSIGYIAFKIKPLDNIVVGDIISGVADIYFDFNPPIITNTAMTEFVDNLGSDDFSLNEISVYPNPTNGLLSIKSNSVIEQIEVFDMLGRKISSQKYDTFDVELNLYELKDGIYFIKIQSGSYFETRKIIKDY